MCVCVCARPSVAARSWMTFRKLYWPFFFSSSQKSPRQRQPLTQQPICLTNKQKTQTCCKMKKTKKILIQNIAVFSMRCSLRFSRVLTAASPYVPASRHVTRHLPPLPRIFLIQKLISSHFCVHTASWILFAAPAHRFVDISTEPVLTKRKSVANRAEQSSQIVYRSHPMNGDEATTKVWATKSSAKMEEKSSSAVLVRDHVLRFCCAQKPLFPFVAQKSRF